MRRDTCAAEWRIGCTAGRAKRDGVISGYAYGAYGGAPRSRRRHCRRDDRGDSRGRADRRGRASGHATTILPAASPRRRGESHGRRKDPGGGGFTHAHRPQGLAGCRRRRHGGGREWPGGVARAAHEPSMDA